MSRMTLRHTRGGFSAIQFFLVVSIIAVATYFMFAIFSETKLRARNEVRNTAVEQYTRVLALLALDHGTYPKIDAACLGDYPDDRCWTLDYVARGDISESSALNARMAPLIQLIAGNTVYGVRGDGGATAYEGYIYRSPKESPYAYQIEWMLESDDAKCTLNAEAVHRWRGYNMTYCVYTHAR